MAITFNHPTFMAISKGQPFEEDLALEFLMTETQRNSLRSFIEELLARSARSKDTMKGNDAVPGDCDPTGDAGYPEMAANLIGWCLRAVHSWTEDVLLLARYLRLLYKLERTEVFHCQCCRMSCCLAKQVLASMVESKYETCLMRTTYETFLLQQLLLHPSKYCCTEALLDGWLTFQQMEIEFNVVEESLNKMVALVSTTEHMHAFISVLVLKFGDKFVRLTSDVALKLFKRHLVNQANKANKSQSTMVAQACDLIRDLYTARSNRSVTLACLLSGLYIKPTDARFSALEKFLSATDSNNSTTAAASPVEPDPLDQKPSDDEENMCAALLKALDDLRPPQWNCSLSWEDKLRQMCSDRVQQSKEDRLAPPPPSASRRLDRIESLAIEPTKIFVPPVYHELERLVDIESRANLNSTTENENKTDASLSSRAEPLNNLRCSKRTGSQSSTGGRAKKLTKTNDHGGVTASPRNKGVQYIDDGETSNVVKPPSVNSSKSASAANSLKSASVNSSKSALQSSASSLSSNSSSKVDKMKRRAFVRPRCSSEESPQYRLRMNVERAPAGVSSEEPCARVRITEEEKFRLIGLDGVARNNNNNKRGSQPPSQTEPLKVKKVGCVESCVKTTVPVVPLKRKPLFLKTNIRRPSFRSLKSVAAKAKSFREKGKFSQSKAMSPKIGMSGVVRGISRNRRSSRAGRKLSPKVKNMKGCFIRLDRIARDASDANNEGQQSAAGEVQSSKVHGAVARGAGVDGKDTLINSNNVKSESTVDDLKNNSANVEIRESSTNSEPVPDSFSTAACVNESTTTPAPCVCDGCGEIVPDCSWLTAHIVTCPCRGASETIDTLTEDDLNDALQVNNCPQIWPAGGGAGRPAAGNAEVSSSGENPASVIAANNENYVNSYVDNSVKNEEPSTTLPFVDDATKLDASSLLHLLETAADQSMMAGFSSAGGSSVNADGRLIFPAPPVVETIVAEQGVDDDDDDEDGRWSYLGRQVTHDGVSMHEFIEYECETCLLTLLNRRAAMQHLQTSDHGHANVLIVNVYCCNHCSIRYRQKQAMWFHVTYLCGRVDASMRAALAQIHGNSADAPAKSASYYKCAICCKQFYAVNYLQRHIYLHHRGQVVPALQQHRGNSATELSQAVTTDTGQTYGPTSTIDDKINWTNYQESGQGQLLGHQGQLLANENQENVSHDPAEQTAELGPQALLDLACSMVLENTVDGGEGDLVVNESNDPDVGNSSFAGGVVRRCAKGIVYKNVFMKCIVNYLCSICHKDLSTKISKKEHKSSPCFDSGVRHFTYVRHYSYLCPYCGDKFPTQKQCREHQLTLCLLVMGVRTDDLNFKHLSCPLCDKKYYNIITLKGHMTLVHKSTRFDRDEILGSCGAGGGGGSGEGGYLSEFLGAMGEGSDATTTAALVDAGWTGGVAPPGEGRAIMLGVDSNDSNDGFDQSVANEKNARKAAANIEDDAVMLARRQRIRDNARKRRAAIKDAKLKLASAQASEGCTVGKGIVASGEEATASDKSRQEAAELTAAAENAEVKVENGAEKTLGNSDVKTIENDAVKIKTETVTGEKLPRGPGGGRQRKDSTSTRRRKPSLKSKKPIMID